MNPALRPLCLLCLSVLLIVVLVSLFQFPRGIIINPAEIMRSQSTEAPKEHQCEDKSGSGQLQQQKQQQQQQQQWHADKFWHSANTLPLCTMDSCFDFTRCSEQEELLIYAYGEPFKLEWYMKNLEGSRWETKDPGKACVFLVGEPQKREVEVNGTRVKRPHPRELPYWNGGLNHAIVTMADKWSMTCPPQHTIGNASILSSSLTLTNHRAGFDISIPLPPKMRLHNLQSIKALDRPFFLTFRGVRYLGNFEGSFRSHPSIRAMNNGRDVVIAMTCNHVSNNVLRKRDPSSGHGCDQDQILFNRYNFKALMNSTFGLVPAGRSPSSYRMLETLSAGTIPVLIVDNYVLPFERLIQWDLCILQFPTSETPRILPALRAISPSDIQRRQHECLRIYNTYFQDDDTMLRTVVASLKQRFYGMFPQFNAHFNASQSPVNHSDRIIN